MSKDANGNVSTTVYDNTGQLKSTVNSLGNRVTFTHDVAGRQIAIKDAIGNLETIVYDANGRTKATIDQLGKRWSFTHDNLGRQVASSNPLGNISTNVYDEEGNVVCIVNPIGNRTTLFYDKVGQNISVKDANGNTITTVYDNVGRVKSYINANSDITTWLFDANGNVKTMIDPMLNRYSFIYDAIGHETLRINPLGNRTTFSYDTAGNQTLRIDGNGNRRTCIYDSLFQVINRRYPDGSRATFTYDGNRNRTLMHDLTGRYSSTFDSANRVITTKNPSSNMLTYSYDKLGNRILMIDPDGGRFTYSYNAKSLMTTLINPQGDRTTYSYDDSGRKIVKHVFSGSRTSWTYNACSDVTMLYDFKSDDTVIMSFDYSYDNAHNRTRSLEANGDVVTWNYDLGYQLLSEHRSGINSYHNTYSYDASGNRHVLEADGAVTTYSVDNLNQLTKSIDLNGTTTYIYDNHGNLGLAIKPNGDRTTVGWSFDNQPIVYNLPDSSLVTFSYSADKKRVQRATSTQTSNYTWDDDNILLESDDLNATQVTYSLELAEFGKLISQKRGSDTRIFHYDATGSTMALSDSDETTTDTMLYNAWGVLENRTGVSGLDYQYNGEVGYSFDALTNTFHVRDRDYCPDVARWLSSDPIGFADSPNLHLYSLNNPIKYNDPSGNTVHVFAWEGFFGTGLLGKGWIFPINAQIKKHYKPIVDKLKDKEWHYWAQRKFDARRFTDKIKIESVARKKIPVDCSFCYHRIILLGYSFGGATCAEMVQRLSKNKDRKKRIVVDGVFTIDPVWLKWWTSTSWPKKKGTVKDFDNFCEWENHYQTVDTNSLAAIKILIKKHRAIKGDEITGAANTLHNNDLNANAKAYGHIYVAELKNVTKAFETMVTKYDKPNSMRTQCCGSAKAICPVPKCP